jgi:tripartite-type tricarboxylate transporter receptor subunit TctC
MRLARTPLAIAIAALMLGLSLSVASAQKFPDRPVKVIVPVAAGGGTDTVARAVCQRLAEIWGQPIVIENRTGAGTTLGADVVAKSPADGYTLMFTDSSTFLISPHIYPKLPYNPLTDLEPVALAVRLAPVLAISANAPTKTMADLITYAKRHPGELSYASPGVGTYTHIAMEHLKRSAGLDILHVPYRGTSLALADLLSGRTTMYMVTYGVFEGYDRDGKLKVVAAATDKRLPLRPDLPTIGEFVPGYAIDVWFGFAAPAGTPAPVLDKIHTDVTMVLNDRKFVESFLAPQAYLAGDLSRQDFAAQIRAVFPKWRELVKASGAREP